MFSSDPVVRITDAHIFQDHNTVLGGINFEIEKGEFVYLVGRTGSGKSSLLKTLYADLPLRLGDIHVCGHNIRGIKANEVPMLRRKLGIIFQDFQLFHEAFADPAHHVMKNGAAETMKRLGLRIVAVAVDQHIRAFDLRCRAEG